MPQPFGPAEHKTVARALGAGRVDDLLAQTRQSDPFYCGTPADQRDAAWFAELLRLIRLDRIGGIHLRRVHYRADALADDLDIRVPGNGRRYGNDRTSWQRLCLASKHARRLGLVNPEMFVDRRNPDPVINRRQRLDEIRGPHAELVDADGDSVSRASLAYLPSIPRHKLLGLHHDLWVDTAVLPDVEVAGYDYDHDDQPVLLEVWCEKSTMNDVLEPVARQVGANYVAASGTQSITNAVALLRRAERHDRPAHVLYISDHDHAGRHMPVSVARDVQFERDRLGVTVPLTIDNLVLTARQVAQYRLPRDPERGDSTELDALEALHPGELARIVEDAAEQFIDAGLERRLDAARDAGVATATHHRDELLADILVERDALLAEAEAVEVRSFRRRLDQHLAAIHELAAELDDEMAPYRERLVRLRDRAAERLADFDPELPLRPTAITVEPADDVLYDSRRGWVKQLDAYRAHTDTGGGGGAANQGDAR